MVSNRYILGKKEIELVENSPICIPRTSTVPPSPDRTQSHGNAVIKRAEKLTATEKEQEAKNTQV